MKKILINLLFSINTYCKMLIVTFPVNLWLDCLGHSNSTEKTYIYPASYIMTVPVLSSQVSVPVYVLLIKIASGKIFLVLRKFT